MKLTYVSYGFADQIRWFCKLGAMAIWMLIGGSCAVTIKTLDIVIDENA